MVLRTKAPDPFFTGIDMVRLAHLSDVHITSAKLEWTLRDWLNKRYAAWFNFRWLGRRHRFRHADTVLARLMDDLTRQRPDHIVFSGDATALGFEAEFHRAAQIMHVDDPERPPGLAVPGNHDYCTVQAAASGLFERYFGSWQTGTRLDGHLYPFAQRVGHVTLVAVNSCTGNRLAWDAGGSVGPAQLLRLKQLLTSLEPGPRILVTHYPICLESGKRENLVHGLRDLTDLVEVAHQGGIGLWLHGHRHHAYHFQEPPLAPFPVICTGSATQNRLWSYGEYTIDGLACRARRRVYDPQKDAFVDGPSFEVRLAG
jgi:3',5'-cyclic AMP phosphodiesterase CpdA